ncbi:MAG: hypothetical protein RLY93_12515 [Sumerlaeia bacterium]
MTDRWKIRPLLGLCLFCAAVSSSAAPAAEDQAPESYIVRFATESEAAPVVPEGDGPVVIRAEGPGEGGEALTRRDVLAEKLERLAARLEALAGKEQAETFAYVELWLDWQDAFREAASLEEAAESGGNAAPRKAPAPPSRDLLEAFLAARERAEREAAAEREAEPARDPAQISPYRSRAEAERAAQGERTPTRREIDFLNQQTNFRYERLIDYYLSTGRDPRVLIPNHYVDPADSTDGL